MEQKKGGDEARAARDAELAALMIRYQAGEGAAFEALYERLARPLRGFLRALTPPGGDVEDLVQTTFLQIHRARGSYLPGRPVEPWVYAIARHVALMTRRASGRRARHESPPAEELPEVAVAPRAEDDLARLDLARFLHRLPEAGREAVWLHHVAGLPFREVAAVQGVTETTAKVRAHRALVALRACAAAEETA